ncbi:Putative glutamine amidotransferase [Planctomycetes bacterium Pan216]|uniref:Glutamine amidotransferase n=1 Tax=Kolteria novifilia TaxID=2527975 RepID=A0A518B4V0_9BACT|nr:Putative glutamine amidotransferase [Planctomycetes bacterium Pan216]
MNRRQTAMPELVGDDLLLKGIGHRPAARVLVSLDRCWYHLLGLHRLTYYRLLQRHGAIPLRIDHGDGPEPEDVVSIARDFVASADALLLSGGADVAPRLYGSEARSRRPNPRRDRFELALIHQALDRQMPILGICRGCQLLNVALGGTLFSFRDFPLFLRRHHHWTTHAVDIVDNAGLRQVLGTGKIPAIRSRHTQAVARPATSLTISAWSDDGLPEAVEHHRFSSAHWVVGVQWHPELMLFQHHDEALIKDFVAAAQERGRLPCGRPHASPAHALKFAKIE